ncbi:hypothetical protein AB4Z29_21830 [Paenibacillus sp. 2TAB23]|uniref:hypothetical protein n=1 Tax=Paenibacillus sp. 2TAB23 TaxID=3233004 RepID=UPI003F97E091
MKFKKSDAQNQRIERMITSHLVVGIDIAKETHVAQAKRQLNKTAAVSELETELLKKVCKTPQLLPIQNICELNDSKEYLMSDLLIRVLRFPS